MEAILNFIFAYPLSMLFLFFVAISSFSHLFVNNKVFGYDYKLIMWVFVPISLLSLFTILFCFEFRQTQVWSAVGIFICQSLISGVFKMIFPRRVYLHNVSEVAEVLGKFTPKYPEDQTPNGKKFDWHVKMDILALLGLWVFIFFDWKILPWIWEGLSLSR